MAGSPVMLRDYDTLLARLSPAGDRDARMQHAVDVFWDALGSETPGVRGVSWIGFYLAGPGPEEMTLAARRNKPACSPIGLQGMCGRCWRDRRSILVRDVRTLGANYIACDPRDQSELVIPCFERDGTCWGVLDADSYDLAAFDEQDVRMLRRALEVLGLSFPGFEAGGVLHL